MNTTIGLLYPDDESFRVLFSERMREAVQSQIKDNELALEACLQHFSLQISGGFVHRADFLTLLCEVPLISTAIITDNFSVTEQELMAIRSAEPISIISCLECTNHLPDDNRERFLRQLRVLHYLRRLEVGDYIKFATLRTLLCDSCTQGIEHCHQEQCRAELLARQARKVELSKMSLAEYLKTPEWRALRNRALIRAGNRCQLCASSKQLNVHHRCYERYGDELLEQLAVLCRECHKLFHGILPEAA